MKTSKKTYSIVGGMNIAEKKAMINVDLESRNLKLSKDEVLTKIYATGKRRAAIAKVWMTPGNGEMIINGKTLDQWLGGHETLKMKVRLPLELTKQLDSMNFKATTLGGGYSAQVDALKIGITRALVEFEPKFREVFKSEGLLLGDNSSMNNRKRSGKKNMKCSIPSSRR